MLKSILATSLLIPLALSSQLHPLLNRQSCSASDEVVCGVACMPSDASCCDTNGDYCPYGEYCGSGGCCPNGNICTGPAAGTETVGSGSSPTNTPVSGHHSGAGGLNGLDQGLLAAGVMVAAGNWLFL